MAGRTGASRHGEVAPPRVVDSDELVGVKELAEYLGVDKSTIAQWDARRRRIGFPLPVARLAMGAIYDRGEVVMWRRRRRREIYTTTQL